MFVRYEICFDSLLDFADFIGRWLNEIWLNVRSNEPTFALCFTRALFFAQLSTLNFCFLLVLLLLFFLLGEFHPSFITLNKQMKRVKTSLLV